jgi:hypothetical protein
MRRRLFAVASGISLLLCLAMVVLWGRSYWRIDTVSVRSVDATSRLAGDHTLRLFRGTLLFEVGRLQGQIFSRLGINPPHVSVDRVARSSVPLTGYEAYTRGVQSRFGFGSGSYTYVQSIDAATDRVGIRSVVLVPLWAVIALTAILPVAWGTLRSAERRRGGCPTCGYNLTGNTSGVCPECGTPVVGKAELKA